MAAADGGACAVTEVRAAWLALFVAAFLVLRRVGARERLRRPRLPAVRRRVCRPVRVPTEVSDVTSSRFMTLLSPSEDDSAHVASPGHVEMFDVIREHPLGLGMGVDEQNLAQVDRLSRQPGRHGLRAVRNPRRDGVSAGDGRVAGQALGLLPGRAPPARGWRSEPSGSALLSMDVGRHHDGGAGWHLSSGSPQGWRRCRSAPGGWRRHDAQAGLRPAKVVALRPAVAPGGVE